ncbi:Asp/Glu/hydantoin racemase [Pseudooceanicola marinus]|uniref:maleate cis-trans isomerase family protein n=1 Tax=Pseudooceanicola marinus TaxID=396013 RepID=UPI001CD29766|nr:Asp/Glu/hydantoin racemase [Pseudooceanicola marinus]MCA1335605.1 Asp/Glu/hydantoin racemase [Pseudooceanicola marinus]
MTLPYPYSDPASYTRIGHIMPSSNTWAEPLTYALSMQEAARISNHFSRIVVKTLALNESSESHFQYDPMLSAARLLADAPLDVITWNGTAASWRGIDQDRKLCELIEAETGITATSATIGYFDLFAAKNWRKISLAVPYTEDVTAAIVENYTRSGFEVVKAVSLGCVANVDIGATPLDRMRALLHEAADDAADCVAVVCTNFPATALAAEYEAETGIPLADSISVTYLDACLKAGVRPAITGWGQMFD